MDTQDGQAGDPTEGEEGYPGAEESLVRLHGAGWAVTGTKFHGPGGPVWIVSGYNGENQVLTASPSRDRAWWEACVQARSVAMLAPAAVFEAVE